MEQPRTLSDIDDISGFPSIQRLKAQREAQGQPVEVPEIVSDESSVEMSEEPLAPEAVDEPIPPKKRRHRSAKQVSVEEAMLALDPPPPGKKVRMTKKRLLEAGLLKVGAEEIQQEEYNHHKIRLAAQKRVLKALNALDRVLDESGDLYGVATPAQVLKAAEIILDRAGDKPATAPASTTDSDDKHMLVLDKSVMPQPPRPS